MSGSRSILGGCLNPPAITELDGSEGLPPSILLETRVYFADRNNSTTATADTGRGHDIQASICFADPPALSYVCIHCPGYPEADFSDEPRVVRSENQFLILHLPLWAIRDEKQLDEYYMYQVVRGRPKLFRLPDLHRSPSTFLAIDDFGIYCCEDGEYILVGLTYAHAGYELHSYSSALEAWTVRSAYLWRLLSAECTPVGAHKVILLGGSLLGWVDLWRGILVCDVLSQDPHLHLGFIPLPFTRSTYHHPCPWVVRDVTCTNGSLELLEIEHLSVPVPVMADGSWAMSDEPYFVSRLDDLERGPCWFVDWRATIWNCMLCDNFWHLMGQNVLSENCWRKAREVHGDDILLVEELGDDMVGGSTVRNMLPSFPILSIHGDHVVHMSSSLRLDKDKTQMISIDMSNNTLKALAPCPPVETDNSCPYFSSELSNYLGLEQHSGDC